MAMCQNNNKKEKLYYFKIKYTFLSLVLLAIFVELSKLIFCQRHQLSLGGLRIELGDFFQHSFLYIRILFFRLRLNILIFLLGLGSKYSCEYS